MTTLKKYTTTTGNKLVFSTTNLIDKEHVIVTDNSCQLERTYIIGTKRELSNYDIMLIESKEQVINAWVNEEIHF